MSDTHAKSVIRIGLDDTDHVEYACTTEHFNSLLTGLMESIDSFEILERRLVRLWPFAPKRTRGNAALSAICRTDTTNLNYLESICQEFMEDLDKEILGSYPDTGQKPSPCLIIATEEVPESMYWESVRGEVSLETALAKLPNSTKIHSIQENPNGIVGASAAIAWNPSENNTWELIAWRQTENIRTDREVSIQALSLIHI